MGLTAASSGQGAIDRGLTIHRERDDDVVVALAGNPNVGKSTVFNALTGMNQHTGRAPYDKPARPWSPLPQMVKIPGFWARFVV